MDICVPFLRVFTRNEKHTNTIFPLFLFFTLILSLWQIGFIVQDSIESGMDRSEARGQVQETVVEGHNVKS